MFVLWTTFAVVMYLGLLAAHEAAHALALRKMGIPISEAGLGLPFSPRIVLKPTKRRPFALSLSIWLLAAYVQPHPDYEKQVEELPYRDKAWFAGAGVLVNAVIATGLTSIIIATQGRWLAAAMWVAITAALWLGRRLVTAYLVPVLAIPLVVFVAWTLVGSLGKPSGPVGMAMLLHVSNPMDALKIVAVMSFALALVNTAPFWPFDGGRIVGEVARRWFGERGERIFQATGFAVVLTLVGYSLLSDGWFLITKV